MRFETHRYPIKFDALVDNLNSFYDTLNIICSRVQLDVLNQMHSFQI